MTAEVAAPVRTSPDGVAFIKCWEGLEKRAYLDVAGVWTIGYGHTAGFRDGRFGPASEISEPQAESLLRADLASREGAVRRLVTAAVNRHEFDALVSFEFNTGALARSTALRRLNAGDRVGAAEALTWWNKARVDGALTVIHGLVRRRAAEAALFLTPV